MWGVWTGRACDIGVLDLELGLEAGLEPEPETGYSTASRQGSLAERVMRCAFLGNGTGDRPAILGYKKAREPGRLLTSSLYFAPKRSTVLLC